MLNKVNKGSSYNKGNSCNKGKCLEKLIVVIEELIEVMSVRTSVLLTV